MNPLQETNQKSLWEKERKKHDLKIPDESVVRFLYKSFTDANDKKILDFGCGSGRNTMVMANMGFLIYAMDYNSICLELTKEKLDSIEYEKIEYIQNEKMSIPLPTASMDCIIAWGVLFTFTQKEREAFLKEMNRVLKVGGVLFADYRTKEDSMYGSGKEIEKDLFCLDEKVGDLKGMIYWFCSREELTSLYCKTNGFEIYNLEQKDYLIHNLSIKNSHFHIWVRKVGNINESEN